MRKIEPSQWCVVLAALLLLSSLTIPSAEAGSGSVKVVPPIPAAAKHGIQVSVDTRGANGMGYRPIRISVQTANGRVNARERTFLIELTPDRNYWESTHTYSKQITLPIGAISAEGVIPIRQSAAIDDVRMAVYEDGRMFDEMHSSINISRGSDHTEMWPSILFIDSKAPDRDEQISIRQGAGRNRRKEADFVDFRAIAQLLPLSPIKHVGKPEELPGKSLHFGENKPRVSDVLNSLRDVRACELLPPSELPSTWRDLSPFDLVFVSLQELEAIEKTSPKKFAALADWVKAGQTLYVYDEQAQGTEEGLKRVDQILGGRFGGWQDGMVADVDRLEDYNVARRGNPRQTTTFPNIKMKNHDFLRIRSCGLGRVVFVAGNPYKLPYGQRVAMLNIVGIKNWSWRERYGISMSQRNSVFWNNLIPGLGLPPVNSFLLVMTVFVVAVGPVSYLFLRRAKRLFLILIVTPAASLLMLIGLLTFAVMSDGFGVKTQIRGITFLDRDIGRASSISHQTYYSSIGGESSLRFPSDSVVFPVKFQPQSRNDRGKVSSTEWDDGQVLGGAYLRPRTMTQFLVSRAGSSTMDLEVSETDAGVQVANNLQSPIQLIFLRRGSSFYMGRNIDTGSRLELEEIDAAELSELTGTWLADSLPEPPPGWDETAFLRFSNHYYYSNSSDRNFGAPDYSTSLLERHVGGLMTNPRATLPDGGFVACVEQSRATPVGVAKPRRYDGLELVFGRWK